MALVFSSTRTNDKGEIEYYDTLADAKVGHWCREDSGLYPDRCRCVRLLENNGVRQLADGIATHYATDPGGIGEVVYYRQGYCLKCAWKYNVAHRIQPIPQ